MATSRSRSKKVAKSAANKPLGSLSAKYEGKIGSANPDVDIHGKPAGWAYGKYQFNSAKGGLARFFDDNPEYAKQFEGLAPETAAFNKKWKEIAKSDPVGFEMAQDQSAERLWYQPAKECAEGLGFKMNDRGVQECVFSGSIQHGGIKTILAKTAKHAGFVEMSAREQINTFYEERVKYYPGGKKRYEAELKEALNYSEEIA